jgi:hypothetical protein
VECVGYARGYTADVFMNHFSHENNPISSMEPNAQTKQWVAGGVAALVVVVGGWWVLMGKDVMGNRDADMQAITDAMKASSGAQSDTSGTMNGTVEVRPTTSVNAGEEVSANDQPAGDSVRVAEARLSRVSWLAVRDDMRIYGAAKVTPPVGGGTMTDITVPLLKNTETGKMYKVVVYADDGDGVFDFKKDALVDGLDDSFSALHGD